MKLISAPPKVISKFFNFLKYLLKFYIDLYYIFLESEDIWERPAAVDEEKTKEQEFDEYFEDLFM